MTIMQNFKVLFSFISVVAALGLSGCGPSSTSTPGQDDSQQAALQIIDVVKGDGATAEPGKKVIVHYTGWLYEPGADDNKGKKFDSSVDRNKPFTFPLGGGRVIKGWDQGVAGMQVGGKRILIIPPQLGYGARGAGRAIPPNATLLFEVELLGIR